REFIVCRICILRAAQADMALERHELVAYVESRFNKNEHIGSRVMLLLNHPAVIGASVSQAPLPCVARISSSFPESRVGQPRLRDLENSAPARRPAFSRSVMPRVAALSAPRSVSSPPAVSRRRLRPCMERLPLLPSSRS